VQLQIIPTAIGFFPPVEDWALLAAGVVELLEPQALRPIEAATSAHDTIATRRAR
jgi:hypothetical protein